MQVASKEEIESIVDHKLREIAEELKHEIRLIGETKYITLAEVAEELHRTKETASKWLDKHSDRIQVIREGKYLINRKDFYDVLREK